MDENKILLVAKKGESTEVETYLNEFEYDVTVINNVADISERLSKEDYGLVLAYMDFVSENFISALNTACVPVMCLVGENEKEQNVDKLYAYGCVDYVTLPTHRRILLTRVKNQIELRADELRMNQAKDYLYNVATAVSHDIKNQFTVFARLSEWLLDSKREQLDDDSKIILINLANFCTKTRYLIDSIEVRTVNQSRHRGGFVRRTPDFSFDI